MSALREDGKATIYKIQTRDPSYKNGVWFDANLDHFGAPEGFSASGDCWQQTGYHGTFSQDEALLGLTWIANKNIGREFRVIKQVIEQQTCEIAKMKVAAA